MLGFLDMYPSKHERVVPIEVEKEAGWSSFPFSSTPTKKTKGRFLGGPQLTFIS